MIKRYIAYYAPPLIGGALSKAFVWNPYIGPNSRTERPTKTEIGTEVAHVTRDTIFKVKGQGHQAALLSAALTREAGAAVTVRTYWAWETTATLRLLGGARGAHGGGEGRGHIVSLRAQQVVRFVARPDVFFVTICSDITFLWFRLWN